MDKIYQPSIIKKVDEIIKILIEINFFNDYEIDDFDFAKTYLSDKLTEKFIQGNLGENDELLTEGEFETCLKEIIAGSTLHELKRKGLIGSYEDDNVEEVFFLTEDGKKLLKEMTDEESI